MINRNCSTYSLLALKAFPLEYGGKGDGDGRLAESRTRRQKAMQRHYRRLLGVTPFEEDGVWMYRINPKFAEVVEAPGSSRI